MLALDTILAPQNVPNSSGRSQNYLIQYAKMDRSGYFLIPIIVNQRMFCSCKNLLWEQIVLYLTNYRKKENEINIQSFDNFSSFRSN